MSLENFYHDEEDIKTIDDLMDLIKDYEPQYKEQVLKGYEFALKCHGNQLRKSGVPYICHPLAVACILAEMKADTDTIVAGLLHDTIEDCGVTKEEIQEQFGSVVANLVDGVTNISKIRFNNDKRLANEETQRKIVESILSDIRVLIIKLADRLHNMRTMQFQTPDKQKEKSLETMEFFIPFATLIGEYTFKRELEDLSFYYLEPEKFKEIESLRKQAYIQDRPMIDQVILEVSHMLNNDKVPFELKVSIKNVYGLFKKMQYYPSIDYVHDLYSVKWILNNNDACYRLRDSIASKYDVLSEKDRDYISNPKPNLYQGLHRSIYLPNSHILQNQMTTKGMHMVNSYGLPAYWSTMSLFNPAEKMQNDVRHFQFYHLLEKLVSQNATTQEFNIVVKDNILKDKIKVYTPTGEIKEMPIGSTPVDFAYQIHSEIGNYITGAIINGKVMPLDTILRDGDVIEIIFDKNLETPASNLESLCKTEYAKKKIKEFKAKNR